MPGSRRRKHAALPPLVLPDYCTEAYVQDWFQYGFDLLCAWLAKHARFADYLQSHPSEPDDPALD
jgi:hypothetical protein